jgi:hypothetical protein
MKHMADGFKVEATGGAGSLGKFADAKLETRDCVEEPDEATDDNGELEAKFGDKDTNLLVVGCEIGAAKCEGRWYWSVELCDIVLCSVATESKRGEET